MSKISDIIFNGKKHYITSPYGKRKVISTSAGNTASFHSGVDYGTDNKKIAQYAIENGKVTNCGKDTAANGYALFVWVEYPRIGKKFLHYHLNDIAVEKGQTVKKGTLLGHTGMTGKATGIHLHLGMKSIGGTEYQDPEAYAKIYEEASEKTTVSAANSFFPKKGYWGRGDVNAKIGKIAKFMHKTFPKYTSETALGNTYGPNLEKAVKEFQKREKITQDGKFGPDTLKHLKKYGFTE